MVSCDKIKRDRASVASPAPFEIPARFLSGEFLAPAFRRMLRSPELSPTASDVLSVVDIIHSFLNLLLFCSLRIRLKIRISRMLFLRR